MKKINSKLLTATILAVIAVTLMVTATYAWFSLAGSPSLTGIQINVGGTNTIMIAPNITENVDGNIVNYPGRFSENLNISSNSEYAYLNTLAGLKPVSTADGINWFIPSSGQQNESAVDLSSYVLDNLLENANVSVEEASVDGVQGSYVYLDFWVVSPLDNCELRISAANTTEGSYVVGLPKVVEDSSAETGYDLDESNNEAAACVRVGFLVDETVVSDNKVMTAYCSSSLYSEEYLELKGVYQEPSEKIEDASAYKFTIYEPNGDMHNNKGVSYVLTDRGISYMICENGDYAVTKPIGYENGQAVLSDVSDILTVQMTNNWRTVENGETMLSQMFQSSLQNMEDIKELSTEEIMADFYGSSLRGTYSGYIDRAAFFNNTKMLYYAGNGSVTTKDSMLHLASSTSTDGAVVTTLEKNVPQRIRMFIWIEGQDIDCVREAALEYLSVGIEFAGSTSN